MIFRRGPSKHVEIIRWDLARGAFERGHWFRGRIHDRRADLSPDGELLVYLAAKYIRPRNDDPDSPYAWTAVSRPPWITALALWPKTHTWWGGGLFTGPRRLWLNHPPSEAEAHADHPPRGLVVETNPGAAGEDEPVYGKRLERDGWTLRQQWEMEFLGPPGWKTLAPEERAKPAPAASDAEGLAIVMQRRIDRFTRREHFAVEGAASEPELPPGPLDWMDWDPDGRIIALSGGRVWVATVADGRVQRFAELLDLRGDVFETREPPPSATAPLLPRGQ